MPNLILTKPIFSEKAQNQAVKGIYTFKVVKKANKIQIRKAVESQFGVKVGKVRIQNYKPEIVRKMRFYGKTKSVKKAIVTVREGSIDLWAPPEKTQNSKLKTQNDKSKSKNKK